MVRRRGFAVLMMTLCLLLSGCAGKADVMQPAMDLRAKLLSSDGCSFTAQIKADFGDTVCEFSADCAHTSGGETRVELTAPETIAGIAATVSESGAKVEFDGMLLELGQLAGGHIAPLSAPSILALCWTGEYIASAGQEGENLLVTYLKGYEKEELTVQTLLSPDGLPVSGEVIYDGMTVLTVSISDFTFL